MDVGVFLAGWEIECCRPPPGEGDRIDWPLLWVDDAEGPGAVDLRWLARPAPAGHQGLLLTREAVTAWWHDAGGVPARGCLVADLHGGVPGSMPLTTGTVTSVHVVTQTYRRTEPRTYVPVADRFELRRVTRGPGRFAGADPGEDARMSVEDSGVLVRLAVETPPAGTGILLA